MYPIFESILRLNRFAIPVRNGKIQVANLDGTDVRLLEGYSPSAMLRIAAFDPSGRLVAAGPFMGPQKDKVIRVWNLESGNVDVLGPLLRTGEGFNGGIHDIEFLDKNHLIVSGGAGLQLFDIKKNSSKILSSKPTGDTAVSRDGRFLVAVQAEDLRKSACQFVRISLEGTEQRLLNSFPCENGYAALDPIEALRREVRTAREVISPNVCRIFDLLVADEQELISMEYIDGIPSERDENAAPLGN